LSPSTVQRELAIIPVAPIDIPRDIAVGHKRHVRDQQTLQEVERHAAPQRTFQERKRPKSFQVILHPLATLLIQSLLVMKKQQVNKYGKMP
jgi:hypothetical protein